MVLGQKDFVTESNICNSSELSNPYGIGASGRKLVVPDYSHNRVLVWNNTSGISNGAPADIVLGQGDFMSCLGNQGIGSPTEYTLFGPQDAWTDGNKLVVVDSGNNRVLIWNTFPTVNNTPADIVIGQPDFLSDNYNIADRYTLNEPYFVHSNGTQLFVPSYNNNRIMVWNQFPSVSNSPADIVLGQANFNDTAFSNTPDGLGGPAGVTTYGNKLIVGESDNNRYIIYNGM